MNKIDPIDDWFTAKLILKRKSSSTGSGTLIYKNVAAKNPNSFIKNINSPEVMVKITGSSKDMSRMSSHINYIARNGDVSLIDQDGQILNGKDEINSIKDQWSSVGIPEDNGKYREALHIVLSMPPETDAKAMLKAVQNFASQEFDGHKYIMAQHLDEKHPHVHICLMSKDINGNRINPRKADLQDWREQFSEKLKEQGIESKATKRIQRLHYKKPEKSNLRNMRKEAQGNFKENRTVRKREMPLIYQERIKKISSYTEYPINHFEPALLDKYKKIVESLEKMLNKDTKESQNFKDYVGKSLSIEPTAEQKIFLQVENMKAVELKKLDEKERG